MTGMWDRDPPSALRYHQLLVHTKILKKIYTTSLMTSVFVHAIVCKEEKLEPKSLVRKGKAMLQTHMYRLINTNRPYDLLDTIMPSADKAERLISTCLTKAGSSGYLGPGIAMRILE